MSRLVKKALNSVLRDSFNQDVLPQESEEQANMIHNLAAPEDEDEIKEEELKETEDTKDKEEVEDKEPKNEDALLKDISSLQVLYQQIKFFHWIANGDNYISIHRFLDEVSDAVLEQIDLLAERMMFLGKTPTAEIDDIAKQSYVKFTKMDNFKLDGATSIINEGLGKIINTMKENSNAAGESNDIGTEKMLQDFIYDLEVLQHHIRSFK